MTYLTRTKYSPKQRAEMWDRGSEMSGHQRFTLETNIDVYFCDTQNPWQRGSTIK